MLKRSEVKEDLSRGGDVMVVMVQFPDACEQRQVYSLGSL
jgi:hypothetical protein